MPSALLILVIFIVALAIALPVLPPPPYSKYDPYPPPAYPGHDPIGFEPRPDIKIQPQPEPPMTPIWKQEPGSNQEHNSEDDSPGDSESGWKFSFNCC